MKHLFVFLNIILVTNVVTGGTNGAGKVVKVNSLNWIYQTSQRESSSTSSLTITLTANIARRCDSVRGKNLWKVGVFGSESQDGSGERYGYVEQILNKKQTCKTVKKGTVFKLRNLRTSFDLDGVSCGDASFFCVELAKNRDSSVNFELRYGPLVNSVAACKPRDCPNPRIAATERNVVAHLIKWSWNISRNPDNSSLPFLENYLHVRNRGDDVSGKDLWQISLFRSTNYVGRGIRQNFQEQVLNSEVSSQPIGDDILHFVVPFKAYAVGCEESPYLCYEFRRNPNASVDFDLRGNVGEAGPILDCRRLSCSHINYKPWLLLSCVQAVMNFSNVRSGEANELAIFITLGVHESSAEVIGGRNMWPLSVYRSRNNDGIEPEKLGYTSLALNSNDTNYSPDIIPGQTTDLPKVTIEFDGSGVGCGDYRFICIELQRHPNSEPDFEVRRCGNKKRIVSCQQFFCSEGSFVKKATERQEGRIYQLECKLEESKEQLKKYTEENTELQRKMGELCYKRTTLQQYSRRNCLSNFWHSEARGWKHRSNCIDLPERKLGVKVT